MSPQRFATFGIHSMSTSARNLKKASVMRTTHLAAVLSLAASACMDVPHRHYTADGGSGSGDGAAARTCDNPEVVTKDLTISSNTAGDTLPTGCWTLSGKLTVSGSSVTSLAKLGELAGVTDLEISTSGLTKIDSKNTIKVTGGVYIHDNSSLADIANIVPDGDRVTQLRIENNSALTGAGGLSAVKYVTNATTFKYNDKLATIDLHEAIRFEGGFDVENDAALTSIDIPVLQSTGDLTISNNQALTSVTMGSLQFVHGALNIQQNPALDLGSAMSTALSQIDSSVNISNNAHLTSLGQFSHTQNVVGTITITGNSNLDYCDARPVGCCVAHAGTANLNNNKNSSCGTHSWCYAQYGGCPYSYNP